MATSLRKPPRGRLAPKTFTTNPEQHRRLIAEATDSLFVRVGDLESRIQTLEDVYRFVTVTTTAFDAGDEGTIFVDDDAAGAPVTIFLPLTATRTTPYYIKKLGSTANVIVQPVTPQRVDRADPPSVTIAVQYDSLRVFPGDGEWWVT